MTARRMFAVGPYKLDISTRGLHGLVELSPAENAALKRGVEFVGEKAFHAPPTNFLGYQWDVKIGVIGQQIYKIAILLEFKDAKSADKAYSVAYDYCVRQLGEPSERQGPLLFWDASNGNVILQREQETLSQDVFHWVLLFLTSNSIRGATPNHAKGPDPISSQTTRIDTRSKEFNELMIRRGEEELQKNPNDFETLMAVGAAYAKLGRYDKSLEFFRRAVVVNPSSAEAYVTLGVTYGYLNRMQERISACKQAIKLNPNLYDAHFSLGGAFIKVDQYELAVQAFRDAIKLRPGSPDAHLGLGIAYVMLGRKDLADSEARTLSGLDPAGERKLRELIGMMAR